MDLAALFPLFKLAGMFGLVVILLRLTSQLGLALGLGAAALGLVFSMSPGEILGALGVTLIDGRFLLVVLVVSLILILSASMEHLGQMEELLRRFKEWVGGRRWGLVAFPALIGLLPMPGGAVFSAPMLDSFDREKRVIPSLKSFLNYWYRHIWEYWWPLYPGVLLACAIAEVDLWQYVLLAFPMTAVAIAGGLPQLMKVPRLVQAPSGENERVYNSKSTGALLPFFLIILPGVCFGIFLQFSGTSSGWGSLPREAGLVFGLLVAVVWAWWDRSITPRQARQILFDPVLPRMWLTLAGVFFFKTVIQMSGAAQEVGGVLVHLNIPLEWLVVVLSLILGVITGLPIAFVGVAYPILAPLVFTLGTSDIRLPLIVLGYVSGFAGVLMSPLHLCLILSNEYFQASWPSVYRRLWLPALIILGGGLGYFWALSALIG